MSERQTGDAAAGGGPKPGAQYKMRFALLYEDRPSCDRAKSAAKAHARNQWRFCEVTGMWKADLLDLPAMAAQAARDASGCDVLVVSLGPAPVITPARLAWIEGLLVAEPGRMALMLVLDREAPDGGAGAVVRRQMEQVCAATGAAFLREA